MSRCGPRKPTKGWLYRGRLFGSFRAGVDFFGPCWTGELGAAFLLLAGQIIVGWFHEPIYAKPRSLLPNMVCHYIVDGRVASIIALIFRVQRASRRARQQANGRSLPAGRDPAPA